MSTRANKVTAPQGQEVEVETFFKGKLRQAIAVSSLITSCTMNGTSLSALKISISAMTKKLTLGLCVFSCRDMTCSSEFD